MADANFTAEQAREKFVYDPATGAISRRNETRWPKVGTLDTKGYLQMRIKGRGKVMTHRIAWLYMTGEWPTHQIDHINGDKTDNRWVNLREVTPTVNSQNKRHARADSTSGVMGVSKNQKNKERWIARIALPGGKRINLPGSFATAEEAGAAYIEAKRRFHDGCTI